MHVASAITVDGFLEGEIQNGTVTTAAPYIFSRQYRDANGRFIKIGITVYSQDVDYTNNTTVGMRVSCVLL